ncbi:hypothetical protein NG797_05435 [Laspinema sp. D5]|nr:hypothetical protein [Laspinema sp. D3d]MCT7987375.1 hypothetical protein [Laspinema sp. D3a]
MFGPELILMSDGNLQNLSPEPQQKITVTVSENIYAVVSTTIMNKVAHASWGTLAGCTNQGCMMKISNYTNEHIKYAGTYIYSGYTTKGTVLKIPKAMASPGLYQYDAASFRGTAGVVGFDFPSTQDRLMILWCVPYSGSSYMNARIYTRNIPIDYNRYVELYYGYDFYSNDSEQSYLQPLKAGDVFNKDFDDYNVQMTLSGANHAEMFVEIRRAINVERKV